MKIALSVLALVAIAGCKTKRERTAEGKVIQIQGPTSEEDDKTLKGMIGPIILTSAEGTKVVSLVHCSRTQFKKTDNFYEEGGPFELKGLPDDCIFLFHSAERPDIPFFIPLADQTKFRNLLLSDERFRSNILKGMAQNYAQIAIQGLFSSVMMASASGDDPRQALTDSVERIKGEVAEQVSDDLLNSLDGLVGAMFSTATRNTGDPNDGFAKFELQTYLAFYGVIIEHALAYSANPANTILYPAAVPSTEGSQAD